MTREEIMQYYTPQNVFNFTRDEERCHLGNSPKLSQVSNKLGRNFMVNLIRQHLDAMFVLLGSKQGPTAQQREYIARSIERVGKDLKLSEFLLFVAKLMCGEYGKFYATIDPMDIITPLRKFCNECYEIKGRHELKKEQEELEKMRATKEQEACTPEEGLAKIRDIVGRINLRKV